ncbi:hypothetical protein HHI36_014035 [Cryptolaemus montrouzieri]|uniref:Gamma-interferon-inducible lysosomal thiol reductase n=1 Tax=Cryptolaemus montrouzieri TaxID=559131 RepID=A0ABD2N1C4_9CUCU
MPVEYKDSASESDRWLRSASDLCFSMNLKKINLFLGIISLITYTNAENNTVKVSIYYESRCPGSKHLITRQVYPYYEDLKDYITLDWVPYGHANQTKENGQWTFECQHGKTECDGNMYQACALDQKKGQGIDAKFINCVMSSNRTQATKTKRCANETGLDWKTISLCFNSNRGKELLAAYGDRTHSFGPRLPYVPFIIYNDVFDRRLADDSLEDYRSTVCTQIPEPRPDVCLQEYE